MAPLNDSEIRLLQEALNFVGPILEKHKEFYPFGMAMDHSHNIYCSEASIGEEYPNSLDVIMLFEDSFTKELNNGNYLLCTICFDIYLKEIVNSVELKKEAIKVRFMSKNDSKEIVLPYIYNNDGTVVFE